MPKVSESKEAVSISPQRAAAVTALRMIVRIIGRCLRGRAMESVIVNVWGQIRGSIAVFPKLCPWDLVSAGCRQADFLLMLCIATEYKMRAIS